MKITSYETFEDTLSLARFNRYVVWAGGDRERAIALYTLNTRASEALYISLHTLEITLRNRIHGVMTELYHENWFREPEKVLGDRQPEKVIKALADLEKKTRHPSADQIVAELTLSFWTAMFGAAYDKIWQEGLYKIARKSDGKGVARKEMARPLAMIRSLRNRIAHHEAIIMWDLPKHYRDILQIIAWLSPVAARWCCEHCRFFIVHPQERIVLSENNS